MHCDAPHTIHLEASAGLHQFSSINSGGAGNAAHFLCSSRVVSPQRAKRRLQVLLQPQICARCGGASDLLRAGRPWRPAQRQTQRLYNPLLEDRQNPSLLLQHSLLGLCDIARAAEKTVCLKTPAADSAVGNPVGKSGCICSFSHRLGCESDESLW